MDENNDKVILDIMKGCADKCYGNERKKGPYNTIERVDINNIVKEDDELTI